MTLIAIATYGKHAEFVVDTMSYSRNATSFGQTTKTRLLHHLDTAILTQGDSRFGDIASAAIKVLSGAVTGFDDLAEHAHTVVRGAWESDGFAKDYPSSVFLVGYSEGAGEFRAFSFSSDRDDFERQALLTPLVMPSPFDYAPSALELDRTVHSLKQDEGGVSDEYLRRLQVDWASRPGFSAPRNKGEWQGLTQKCRQQRALDPSRIRTPVGGAAHHTRISRGKSSTHVIHQFDDSGAELMKLVAGTVHPLAQQAPCVCGSGQSYRECCLVQHLDSPCNCDSGETLGECCAIDVPAVLGEVN